MERSNCGGDNDKTPLAQPSSAGRLFSVGKLTAQPSPADKAAEGQGVGQRQISSCVLSSECPLPPVGA